LHMLGEAVGPSEFWPVRAGMQAGFLHREGRTVGMPVGRAFPQDPQCWTSYTTGFVAAPSSDNIVNAGQPITQ
jgi:hypothetical protein